MRLILKVTAFCLLLGSLQSCVSKKKYDELFSAKEATDAALAETQANLATLKTEKDALQAEFDSETARLNGEISGIRADLDATKSQMTQVQSKLTMTEKELADMKGKIDGIFSAYSSSGLSLQERSGQLYVVSSAMPASFRSGSSRLNRDQRKAIDALAETLKANPAAQITLVGHTDDKKFVSGSSDNWTLSVARAKAVAKRLIRGGVSPSQLTIAGRGEYDPVGSNETADGRAQNRRVDMKPNPALGTLKSN